MHLSRGAFYIGRSTRRARRVSGAHGRRSIPHPLVLIGACFAEGSTLESCAGDQAYFDHLLRPTRRSIHCRGIRFRSARRPSFRRPFESICLGWTGGQDHASLLSDSFSHDFGQLTTTIYANRPIAQTHLRPRQKFDDAELLGQRSVARTHPRMTHSAHLLTSNYLVPSAGSWCSTPRKLAVVQTLETRMVLLHEVTVATGRHHQGTLPMATAHHHRAMDDLLLAFAEVCYRFTE